MGRPAGFSGWRRRWPTVGRCLVLRLEEISHAESPKALACVHRLFRRDGFRRRFRGRRRTARCSHQGRRRGQKDHRLDKETDKEIEIKITDDTEQVSKKGNGKVDLEKLETKVKKTQDAGKKVNIKVTHDKKVASKLEFPKGKGAGKKKDN